MRNAPDRKPLALSLNVPDALFERFREAANRAFRAREGFMERMPGAGVADFDSEAYAMALAEAWLSAEVGRFFQDSTARLNMEAEQWRLRTEGVIA